MASENSKNPLIDRLVADLAPVRPMRMREGLGSALAMAAVTVLASAVLFGLRGDLMSGALDPVYILSLGLTLMLAIASAVAVVQMGRPQVGGRSSGWAWAAAMAALLPLASLITNIQFYAETGATAISGGGIHCVYRGIVLSLAMSAVLTLWLRRGAPTSPTRAGWLTGIAAGSIGIFAVALGCDANDIGHIGFWHGLSVIGSALLGRLIVPPLVRW